MKRPQEVLVMGLKEDLRPLVDAMIHLGWPVEVTIQADPFELQVRFPLTIIATPVVEGDRFRLSPERLLEEE